MCDAGDNVRIPGIGFSDRREIRKPRLRTVSFRENDGPPDFDHAARPTIQAADGTVQDLELLSVVEVSDAPLDQLPRYVVLDEKHVRSPLHTVDQPPRRTPQHNCDRDPRHAPPPVVLMDDDAA